MAVVSASELKTEGISTIEHLPQKSRWAVHPTPFTVCVLQWLVSLSTSERLLPGIYIPAESQHIVDISSL